MDEFNHNPRPDEDGRPPVYANAAGDQEQALRGCEQREASVLWAGPGGRLVNLIGPD